MREDGKIDYLELPAGEIAAVKPFYAAAFGWTFTDYGASYIAFKEGLGGHGGQGEGRRRDDHQGDLQLSRRPAVPLRRSRGERDGGVERGVGSRNV